MSNTRITTYTLLLLLSISLFSTLNILPVQAIVPNRDAIFLKEYKQWSSYNPDFTFSASDGILQMMSTQNGLGNAYAFLHIDRNELHGNKLRIRWRWYLDYSNTQYTLAYVYVVNNVHNRKLENSGEFWTNNNVEHPVVDFTHTTACSLTATCNGGWISWTTSPPSAVLNLAGWNDQVTIMIKIVDPWIANTVGLQVDYLQILNPNNQVLKTYAFSGSVYMDKTGGYYDYGWLRNPTSVLYGTRNYAGDTGAPPGELQTSEAINNAIYNLFINRGYYVGNFWGSGTTQYYVNYLTYNCERYYDYSMVLYKGHTFVNYHYYYPCGVPNCSFPHNAVHYDAYYSINWAEHIRDYHIDESVRNAISVANKNGTHYFVFMWTCGLASPTYIGVFNEAHSSSFLPSWMHFDPWSLNTDGYHGTPDYSDRVFIGFEWLSKNYLDTTGRGSFNYGHWIWYFYYYLLNGYTVKAALDQATRDTHFATHYDYCPLDNGYYAWNPIEEEMQLSRMRIWGDSSARLPR